LVEEGEGNGKKKELLGEGRRKKEVYLASPSNVIRHLFIGSMHSYFRPIASGVLLFSMSTS
jgi:hypothetical protein